MTSAGQDENDLLSGRSPARKLARRLIEARRSGGSDSESPARAAAAAADGLYRDLSRWVGIDGCYALFSRSLSEARSDFPALAQIEIQARSQPHVDAVAETIMARGDPATAEALEFMIERLVELLGRLIGDDMATKLIERSLPASEGSQGSADRQEEA
jgi:hypothetical protein